MVLHFALTTYVKPTSKTDKLKNINCIIYNYNEQLMSIPAHCLNYTKIKVDSYKHVHVKIK